MSKKTVKAAPNKKGKPGKPTKKQLMAAKQAVVADALRLGQAKTDAAQEEQKKRAQGRPTLFTPELGEEICRRLVEKGSLRRVCKDDDMPCFGTVYAWDGDGQKDIQAKLLTTDKAEFSGRFARARVVQAHGMVDDARDIADDGSNDWQLTEKGFSLNHEHVQRSSLRVNTILKMAQMLAPKDYAPMQKMADAEGGKLPAAAVTPLQIVLTTKAEVPDA